MTERDERRIPKSLFENDRGLQLPLETGRKKTRKKASGDGKGGTATGETCRKQAQT